LNEDISKRHEDNIGPKTQELTERRIKECLFANSIRTTKSWRMGWVRHVARVRATRSPYRSLVGKLEAKMPLGRIRHGCEDNIKMYRK
jgi:hypothetical protein